METPVVKSRGRPRKRRREDAQIKENENCNPIVLVQALGSNDNYKKNENNKEYIEEDVRSMRSTPKRGRPPKRRAVEVKGEAAVGRYVLKEFEGSGVFLGKILSYDSGFYRVDYEDGDFEDLDNDELHDVLIVDERQRFVGDLLGRKKKLDQNIAEKCGGKVERGIGVTVFGKVVEEQLEKGIATGFGNVQGDEKKAEVPTLSDHAEEEVDESEVDDDDDVSDSCSESCEYGQGWEIRSEIEIPAVPPPELPPSSGTVGVPEEYVPHLFSVYGFLRSFSIRLFLSPFTLDDLVGCLNCNVPNTLLDAIHVALLRTLRRHLEAQASDGSEHASKWLRCIDWGFLDILTWPVYLVHYLMVMGHINQKEWKGFYMDVLQKDYCTLSVGMKLTVLQILCDDALDTAEMRAEVDIREESEVGVESDWITSNVIDNGPRKVYPRSAKTSVGKDMESFKPTAENIIAIGLNTLKSNDEDTKSDYIDEDVNGDECRLCGMDGMLLCCDGCPSAYHSRCIGVNKLSIPEGKWFCHDCKISRVDPPITTGTSLRGAESFGVDPYSQLFLGTCNHLLVLKVSIKASSFVRYYSHNDIPKVIMALCSSPHHAVSYSGICQAILKYWELPQVRLAFLTSNQTFMDLEKKDDSFVAPFTANGNKGLHKAELEDNGTCLRESVSNHISEFGLEKRSFMAGSDDVSLGGPIQTDISMVKTNSIIMNEIPTNISSEHAENIEQIPTNMSSELGENPERPCVTRTEQDDGFIMTVVSACTFGNKSSSVERKDGYLLPHKLCMNQKEESNRICDTAVQHMKDACLYMGSNLKPHAYVNNYVHGEFAGCAAANYAVLSSDDKRLPELHASDPRKVMSANVVLQTKAFSSAAVRFFWPSTEKKLVEIPRERCSWCLHCKAPATSKKACLLNQAALNATRAPMKFCSGLKLVKNVEAGLYGISAYMLYIEESLRGLIVGPFLSASYQKQWCKKVEQASTCNEIKSLLLELEENICTNALLSEWTKLVDNWTDEFSVPQSTCATGSTQKRCTGRRRKHLSMSDNIADDSNDSSRDLNWRNGKLSKLVFQRGTLPSPVLRKTARQGGSRKISGIQYTDSSDVPKRSRQFLWRAAVEMSLNASGLALQVRYLDHHIKWSDLLRPEQSAQDGRGLESEAYAFRSARICDRRVVDSKIMYGVVFGHQKHLSNRLMKSVMEKEETQDGKEKYWFLETRIPLYLIKEYEEHAEKIYLPPSRKPGQEPDQEPEKMPNQTLEQKLDDKLSEHQKRQLIAFRRSSYYLYLTCKREDAKMCYCASCHRYMYTRNSAKCDACEGFCHEGCVINSTFGANDDVALRAICNQCSAKDLNQNNNKVESPTSPLAVQGPDFHNSGSVKSARLKAKASSQLCQISATVLKGSKAKSTIKAAPSIGTSESYFDKKPKASCGSSSSKKKRSCHWGLIWKKKPDDDGSEFRSKNILFRGTSHDLNLITPECQLCQKPYSPHLMYIRCETCQNWHHADAVELDESKLSSLVGYKCCRCRRIKTPVCPYADKNTKNKKLEVKKIIIRGPKEETMLATDSLSDVAMSEQEESLPSTPMSLMEDDVFIEVDDPLLLSVSKVEEIPEPNEDVPPEWTTPFGFGPQKLPVRRQIKNERDDDGLIWSENSAIQLPTSPETKEYDNSHFKYDVFSGGFEDGSALEYEDFDYDNTEYEPQTYFSYTELLDTDDGNNQFGAVDACVDGWENMPCEYVQSGFPEHCDIESFDDLLPAASMDSIMDATCSICLQTAPVPDLVCYSCGLQIHSVCSPGEVVSLGESWRCGNCRE